MTTYASPRLTRLSLLLLISLIFLSGTYMLFYSTIRTIDYVGHKSRMDYSNHTGSNLTYFRRDGHDDDDDYKGYDLDEANEMVNRFPSISSSSVQLILALLTIGHGIFGIIAITKERLPLISSYSYILVISCFTKLIFIIASLMMYTLSSPNQNMLTSISSLIILSLVVEIILVMFACQFGKLVKRGDAARQEIQSIHSYHMERRSRSRSHSQSRFRFANSPYLCGRPTPLPMDMVDKSLPNSRAVSLEPSSMISNPPTQTIMSDNDSASYQYIPPPIFLKLDK